MGDTDQRRDLAGHEECSSVFQELLLLLYVICTVVWETHSWFKEQEHLGQSGFHQSFSLSITSKYDTKTLFTAKVDASQLHSDCR